MTSDITPVILINKRDVLTDGTCKPRRAYVFVRLLCVLRIHAYLSRERR